MKTFSSKNRSSTIVQTKLWVVHSISTHVFFLKLCSQNSKLMSERTSFQACEQSHEKTRRPRANIILTTSKLQSSIQKIKIEYEAEQEHCFFWRHVGSVSGSKTAGLWKLFSALKTSNFQVSNFVPPAVVVVVAKNLFFFCGLATENRLPKNQSLNR